MKKRPNIIFIMTDQQRYDTMGCVNPKVITPNLDKLIENSVFFENGRCSNPSCVPSRAGIMTGKFPSQCQVPAYISYLPDTEKTFMKRLKENGYYTAVVGKQHFAESTIDNGYDYEMYELNDMEFSESTYEDLEQKGPQFRNMGMYSQIYLKDYTKEQFLKTKRSYYANITLIDEKIGEVLEVLKKYNAYDDTVIIYTSDHGDFMGDYGLVEKLQCLEESLMRVPLFVKPPIKDFEGVHIKDDVLNIDVAATCMEISETKLDSHMSNYSYVGYWDKTKEIKKRPYIYMEAGEIRGIISDGIKTIHYVNRPYGEMYDLNKDPLERNNLWNDKEYESIKLQHYRYLVDSIYEATPGYDTPWNIGTPEI